MLLKKAYEEGISKDEFMTCYRRYIKVVVQKVNKNKLMLLLKRFHIIQYIKFFQKAKDNDWIDMR